MNFTESIRSVFSKYATFSGRASRSEFWWWYLFVSLVNLVMSFIWNMSTMGMLNSATSVEAMLAGMFNWAYYLWIVASLALLLPTLGVIWRRLHDTNRSGGFYFLGLIPIVGIIVLLVFWVQDSTPGANRFGENPKTS
jgi:uncharacterized membrane protein YhaH (DUF805 family)